MHLKPVLRWAGSKQRLLPALAMRMPANFNRYFEPFAGSASLFFAVRPELATLSDINAELVNFYKVLRIAPEEVYRRMIAIPRTEHAYIESREEFAQAKDKFERAALFWYLNRHCFNGLFRTNQKGKFNVPYGSKLPPLPEWPHVKKCAARLRRASIRNEDFQAVVNAAGEGDFIYVDPPYRRTSTRNRGEYGLGAMLDQEMSRLVDSVKSASDRGAKVLISYNTDLSGLLPGWNHNVVNGRHLISADPLKRVRINEYTSFNYPSRTA